MLNALFRTVDQPGPRFAKGFVLVVIATIGLGPGRTMARAQTNETAAEGGGCTLKNYVYTCDGAAFQKALADANTVAIETHNADGMARGQLKDFLTKKLAKTIAPEGSRADLIFLLMPVGEGGEIDTVSGDTDLGTLRVYSAAPDGTRGHLLWAETFSGQRDVPWPAVVRGLILQFRSHFHIQ
jgi:hypothetical protein